MKVVPAIDGLAEFRPDGFVAVKPCPEIFEASIAPESEPVEAARAAADDTALHDAVAAAVRSARQETDEVWSQRLEAAKQSAEEMLERERQDFIKQSADTIAATILSQFDILRQSLTHLFLAECRPFLSHLAAGRAIDELKGVIDTIMEDASRVRISGPAALLDQLRPGLASPAIDVEWCEDDTVDVSITAGDTVAVTRLTEWLGQQVNEPNA